VDYWVFKDCVSPAGNNVIAKWVTSLTIQERANLEALLKILSRQKQWSMPDYRTLSGHKGIGEIRFSSEQGTPLRLLGTKGDAGEFILLVGCSHKGSVYKPPDAITQAFKRMKSINNDTGWSTCDHEEDD